MNERLEDLLTEEERGALEALRRGITPGQVLVPGGPPRRRRTGLAAFSAQGERVIIRGWHVVAYLT